MISSSFLVVSINSLDFVSLALCERHAVFPIIPFVKELYTI